VIEFFNGANPADAFITAARSATYMSVVMQ